MNKQLLIGLAVLFVFAACTPTVPVGDNETNVTNQTGNFSSVDDNTTDMNIDEDSEYAATIRATEEDLIELNTRAVDPDGDDVTLYFDEPFNAQGQWQTKVGDAGEYDVDVIASDGQENTSLTLLVIVDALNLPPSIQGPDVIEAEEGEVIDLTIYNISDPEGDDMVISYSGWMDSSSYRTNYDDAGEYEVRIIAEDTAGNEVFKEVGIVVENVNREPVLEINNTSIEAVEGDRINLRATATDPDGDEVVITYEEPFNNNGVWQSQVGDAGEYTVTVTATDGENSISEEVSINVGIRNRAPVIVLEDEIVVNEGETLRLSNWITISDPDGDEVVVNYRGWMTSSSRYLDYGDAGTYTVTIKASDENLETVQDVTITVQEVNRPPVFVNEA